MHATARLRRMGHEGGIERIRRAIEAGDADRAVRCAVAAGRELSGRGDIEAALAGYRAVVVSGLTLSAENAISVGYGLARLGAKVEAREVCQSVLEREGELEPDDVAVLGNVLLAADDLDGAEHACRRAVESGDPTARAWATCDLGDIHARRGNLPAAREMYQRVVDSKHWEMAPVAAYNLGVLLMEIGDRQGAMDAYGVVVAMNGALGRRALAGLQVGALRREAGDQDGAYTAFKIAIVEGDPDSRPRGLVAMGELLRDRGDVDSARRALRLAVESGHPEMAQRAESLLAAIAQAGS